MHEVALSVGYNNYEEVTPRWAFPASKLRLYPRQPLDSGHVAPPVSRDHMKILLSPRVLSEQMADHGGGRAC